MTDKEKRDLAVDDFARAIKARLDEQAAKGYTGWDGDYSAFDIHREIVNDACTLLCAFCKCVDIGARAMMLHYRQMVGYDAKGNIKTNLVKQDE